MFMMRFSDRKADKTNHVAPRFRARDRSAPHTRRARADARATDDALA